MPTPGTTPRAQRGTSIQPEALMIAMVMPAERSRVIAGRNSDTHDVR